jgi:hypothetical protein
MPQYRPLTQTDNRLSLSIKRPVSEGLEWISNVQADGSPGNLHLPSRNLIRRGAIRQTGAKREPRRLTPASFEAVVNGRDVAF